MYNWGMKELFKKAIKITNDNIILAIPLMLFMWIIGAYIGFAGMTADTLGKTVLSLVTIWFLFALTLSGWFYMVKKAVRLYDKVFETEIEHAKAIWKLFTVIPDGIGKYFASFAGMALVFAAVMFIFGFIIYQTGIHIIGNLDLSAVQIKQAMVSPDDMRTFVDGLSEAQLMRLSMWNMLFIAGTSVMSFLTMLWVPEVMFSTKNPLTALFRSVKKLFNKPRKSLLVFLFITALNILLSFVSTFAMLNPVFYLVIMLAYFYFIVYAIVTLFTYYEWEFCEKT